LREPARSRSPREHERRRAKRILDILRGTRGQARSRRRTLGRRAGRPNPANMPGMQRGLELLLCLAATLPASAASARDPEPPPAACKQPGALSRIACELAAGLGEGARGAVVVAAAPRSDRPLRDPAGLARRLASVTAGVLGEGTRGHT